jgi:hypothetical protein
MRTKLWVICLAGALVASGTFVKGRARELSDPSDTGENHSSGLVAKVTMADGSKRLARLEGVGCAASMCSRTFIETTPDGTSRVKTWLDSIAAIRPASPGDALFLLKDGTEQRRSLVTGFRVLYLSTRLGGTEKLDLGEIQSVEFAAAQN